MHVLAIVPIVLALTDAVGVAPAEQSACVTAIRVSELADRTRIEIDIARAAAPTVLRGVDGASVVCRFDSCEATLPIPDKVIESPRARAMRVSRQGGSAFVEIALASKEIEHRYFRLEEPPRFVIDLLGKATTPRPRKPASVPAPAKPKPAAPKTAKGSESIRKTAEKELAAGEIDKGLASLEAAVSLEKTVSAKRDLLLRVAREARREGLFSQAMRCLTRVLSMSPPETLAAQVHFEIGGTALARGQVDPAVKAFGAAIASGVEPMASAARRERADCLLGRGRGEEAVEDLRALARDGRDETEEIYAGYRLGVLHWGAGRTDEALAAFEGVSSEPPQGADSTTAYFCRAALLRRGDILFKSGHPSAAISVYERIVSVWGTSDDAAWALFQIGNAERREGKVEAALGHYREVLARWPESRWAGMAAWGADECERRGAVAKPTADAPPPAQAAAAGSGS